MVFQKDDRVKSKAVLYDEGTEDANGLHPNPPRPALPFPPPPPPRPVPPSSLLTYLPPFPGLTFSQREAAKGNGEWCHGKITWVYARPGRTLQRYRVKWDEGSVTQVEHQHLEPCDLEEDDDADAHDEIDPEDQVDQCVHVDGDVTDSDDDNASAEEDDDQTATVMNSTVVVDGVSWKRVPSIAEDTYPDFDLQVRNLNITDNTREKELFDLCMPVTHDMLLEIVRERAAACNDKYKDWNMHHIEATFKVIFGGAQFKTGTDLWATETKGLMPPPDFGRYYIPVCTYVFYEAPPPLGRWCFFFWPLFETLCAVVPHMKSPCGA